MIENENKMEELLEELRKEVAEEKCSLNFEKDEFKESDLERYKRRVIEAGDILLGGMLLSKENFEDYYEITDINQFITTRQKLLFLIFILIEEKDSEEGVNLKTVLDFFKDNNLLDLITRTWLLEIINKALDYKKDSEKEETSVEEGISNSFLDEIYADDFDELEEDKLEIDDKYSIDLDACSDILNNYFQFYELLNSLKPAEDPVSVEDEEENNLIEIVGVSVKGREE